MRRTQARQRAEQAYLDAQAQAEEVMRSRGMEWFTGPSPRRRNEMGQAQEEADYRKSLAREAELTEGLMPFMARRGQVALENAGRVPGPNNMLLGLGMDMAQAGTREELAAAYSNVELAAQNPDINPAVAAGMRRDAETGALARMKAEDDAQAARIDLRQKQRQAAIEDENYRRRAVGAPPIVEGQTEIPYIQHIGDGQLAEVGTRNVTTPGTAAYMEQLAPLPFAFASMGRLTKLIDLVGEYGTESAGNEVGGQMEAIWSQGILDIKEADRLGALDNGAIQIGEGQVPNPTSTWRNIESGARGLATFGEAFLNPGGLISEGLLGRPSLTGFTVEDQRQGLISQYDQTIRKTGQQIAASLERNPLLIDEIPDSQLRLIPPDILESSRVWPYIVSSGRDPYGTGGAR